MSTLSEGELHVQAMRLVCEALADREKTGLEVDWDVLCHMHDHMDVIFRGIEDQRRDDQDELMHTRKDRDHWRQARQEAMEAGELMRAEIETLREKLDATNRFASTVASERDAAHAAATAQQRDEIAYLRAELAKANENRVDLALQLDKLREQLDAAWAVVTLQRAGIERLQAFVNLSRRLLGVNMNYADVDRLRAGLAELDAGTEPAPVAEPPPCQKCESTLQQLAEANKQWQLVAQSNSAMDAARKKIAEQEAHVADLNDKLAAKTLAGASNLCREIERLQLAMNDSDERITNLVRFVEKVRPLVNVPRRPLYPSDIDFVRAALAELDDEPTPVAEPLDAEGGA